MASAAVLERRARAVDLVRAGRSYDDVASGRRLNRSGAWKAVQSALSDRVVESADELRILEVSGLDAIQAALWDKATVGDVRAGMAILRIIEQRARLLGLFPERKPGRKPSAPLALVSAEFWDHVREVHGGDYRVCRCPEIIGDVTEDEIRW